MLDQGFSMLKCNGAHGVVLSGCGVIVGVAAGIWLFGLGLCFHPTAKARQNESNLPAKETMSSISVLITESVCVLVLSCSLLFIRSLV